MDPIQRFAEYAGAFEKAFVSDDWAIVEPFFTEDAEYETLSSPPFGGRIVGRDAVMTQFKNVLDGFDRRFDERNLELVEGPALRDGAVWIRWRVTYRLPPGVESGQTSIASDRS